MLRKSPGLLALLFSGAWLLGSSVSAQPIGVIDQPAAGQTVSGVVKVTGWVLDFNAVDKIELLVDGVVANRADINLPRVDVLEAFPNYFNSATPNPGFVSSFLASRFTNGPHTIEIRVTESNGATFLIGSRTVIVDNNINQAPFGYIDIPGPAGVEGTNGSFPVTGWAIDDEDVDHIDFLMDGQIVAGAVGRGLPSTAVYGSTRPDVQAAFPDVPNSLFSGFQANIDTTKLINGMHQLSVRVTDNEGASRVIGTRNVQIINVGSNLAPFGRIDVPLDKASLFCSAIDVGIPSPCPPEVCRAALPNLVAGWALDVGARLDQGQVAFVELLLDGAILANTRTDCLQVGRNFINCYGINRPDVARNYSGYVNADNAGFAFSFALIRSSTDPSGLIAIARPTVDPETFEVVGYTLPGKHTLAVRVGDEEETVTQLGAMSVDVFCDEGQADRPAFGYIDQPFEYQFINGIFTVLGWAVDLDGVQRIEVDVDGQVVGTATYGLARPDVPANDPRVASINVGFSFALDTTRLSDSEHDLVIYVVDRGFGTPRRTEIGRRKFVVNNNVLTHR
jgi:large repetitive protein